MGAKLTKSKSVSISGKTNGQHKEISTIIANTKNHFDVPTNEDNPQVKTKNKKKKEQKVNKKTSKTNVDKSTNTEICVLPSSSTIEQLVDHQASTANHNDLLNNDASQVNIAHQMETPSKDAEELQNNIISSEFHVGNQQNSNEQEYQANNLEIAGEPMTNTRVIVISNNGQVHSEEQQSTEP